MVWVEGSTVLGQILFDVKRERFREIQWRTGSIRFTGLVIGSSVMNVELVGGGIFPQGFAKFQLAKRTLPVGNNGEDGKHQIHLKRMGNGSGRARHVGRVAKRTLVFQPLTQ